MVCYTKTFPDVINESFEYFTTVYSECEIDRHTFRVVACFKDMQLVRVVCESEDFDH